MEYSKWENFHKVIKRAMISCENSGRRILDQFPEVRNLVEGGVAPRSKIAYMGSTKLIANLFSISQTEEKLCKDRVEGAENAINIQQIEQEQMARLKAKAKKRKILLDE